MQNTNKLINKFNININKTIEDELYKLCNKNKHNKSILVLGGGGIKGFVFIGVAKYLEELNIFNNIDTFIGTSIGAFFSILFIVGYTADELYKIIKSYDLTKTSSFNLNTFLDNFSIDDCENVILLFNKLLINKKFNPNITMMELYQQTKKKLVTVSVCITTKKLEYMSYENFPELPVILAVRMSTCIPLIFPPVKYNNKLYIDGGLIENFPIKYVKDSDLYKVIGINIFTDFADEIQINDIHTYVTNIFDVIMMLMTRKFLEEKYKNIVYNIDVEKLNPIGFDISITLKKDLYKIGYEYMKKHFKLN